VDVASYDGSTDAMREVETNKLDATVQDAPAAIFYRSRFPGLRAVDGPVGRGYYVVYARKGDTALVHAMNEALSQLIERGELETLYRAYGIWDVAQRELYDIARAGKFYGYRSPSVEARPVVAGLGHVPAWPSARESISRGGRRCGADLIQSAAPPLLLVPLFGRDGGLFIAIEALRPAVAQGTARRVCRVLSGTPVMLQLYSSSFSLEIDRRSCVLTAILGLHQPLRV
jgi:hypothetical protein